MFKEIEVGAMPTDMSVREYERCLRSINRRNLVVRIINKLLSLLQRKEG